MTRAWWFNEPWTTRPHPTDWKENTVTARGLDSGPLDPQRTLAAGFDWGAMLLVAGAAVIAGGMLAAAKLLGGGQLDV